MKDNDSYFNLDSRHDCDDFDFCDEDCEMNYESGRRIRDIGRMGDFNRRHDMECCDDNWHDHDRDCECHRGRDRDCECGRDRDKDCECTRNRDKECECDRDRHRDGECRCDNGFDFRNSEFGDCCEETVHCSDCRDFNEDERFGCNVRCDAAQSDDSWFECQEEECCKKCRTMCDEEKCFCRKLKCRIQVLDFVLQETILFLNTHPCDWEALRYYRIIRRKLARLERLYECKCGPLTNKGVDTEFGWEWACCPWPWEGKD